MTPKSTCFRTKAYRTKCGNWVQERIAAVLVEKRLRRNLQRKEKENTAARRATESTGL